MGLARYHAKRNFERTAEPRGGDAKGKEAKKTGDSAHSFVIQKHAATRLHYDFRLEWGGVLKSWAIPKGPSFVLGEKRLAVEVEDHPVEYANFEGTIPHGEYGGGAVIVWDRGDWTPHGDVREGLKKGNLKFSLDGEKMHGSWALIRLHNRDGEDPKKHNWLLIKERDEFAKESAKREITETHARSVLTKRTVEEVAAEKDGAVWHSKPRATAATPKGAAHEKIAKIAAKSAQKATKPEARPQGRAPLPKEVAPQLATLVDAPPVGPEWVFEIKFDGYRIVSTVARKQAALASRNGKDWSARFPEIRDALAQLEVRSAIFDGEVCAVKKSGVTDFQALQGALHDGKATGLVYYVFDLLYVDGKDLRNEPLSVRKKLLAEVLGEPPEGSPLRVSEHLEGSGEKFFGEARRLGLEGIIAKRLDRPYVEKRSLDWQKIKCGKRQELTIVGYTKPSGSRKGLGALLLGVSGKAGETRAKAKREPLRYAGKVGTGFSHKVLLDLYKRLHAMEVDTPPVVNPPRLRDATWVRPELVCEVAFTEWTHEGSLRHPSFLGLREDKEASDVIREEPVQVAKKAASKPDAKAKVKAKASTKAPTKAIGTGKSGDETSHGVRLTHPERVLDATSKVTKEGLAAYYEALAPEILRYGKDRPLALVRCPDGTGGETFFQKHKAPWMGPHIQVTHAKGDEILYVSDPLGVVELAQVSALEIHMWGSTVADVEAPNLMVLDLDPDEGLPWARVATAAIDLRDRLKELGLTSFVKTTGGKGLHVVVPIAPIYDWETFKAFSQAIAHDAVRRDPKAYTANMAKAARKGKIFLDYLRNGRGATAVVPYSPRARPGLPVAVPIPWKDVASVVPSELNVTTVAAHVRARKTDPWDGITKLRQRFTKAALAELDPHGK